MHYYNFSEADIEYKTRFGVYVQSGEVINMGNSAMGFGMGDIEYLSPQ
ncbi:MAG: hypothetical protein H6765_03405 [Candidatus Peribacteria bacterium]|nr:MAG: hypothetical protein H6765_03405 [Candidatus Peribacteria bacterium]